MNLSKRIRDCRYSKGWGPDELASRAEISRTALYQIECGKTETPRAGTLRRIARALDVSIEVLLGNAARDLEAMPGGPETDDPFGEDERPSATNFGRSDVPAPEHGGNGLNGGPHFIPRSNSGRRQELEKKFQDLLASPLGESLARIVEESHRLLPSKVTDIN